MRSLWQMRRADGKLRLRVQRAVGMKLYILTAPKQEIEALQYANSMVEVVTMVDNMGLALQAVEEIPNDAKVDMPMFSSVSRFWSKKK